MGFKEILKNRYNFDLKKYGVLGINARNLDYIFVNNRRKFYPLVDDKVETKKIALAAGIRCPETYAIIEYQDQVPKFAEMIGEHKDFVIKPAQGSGGEGILVIADHNENGYVKSSGAVIDYPTLRYHLNNTLNGLYSLGGTNDKVLVEYRVKSIKDFIDISYQGVPDIRLIVYKGVTVMAMLRLPTRKSDGKANLHSGGVGIGVNIKEGVTTHAIQKNVFINNHPDTNVNLRGIEIPYWQDILNLASRFDSIIGLGYIGVDIVIDQKYGPMLLEVNARPGISIQIANKCGLKPRLDLVDKHILELKDLESKIAFSLDNFS